MIENRNHISIPYLSFITKKHDMEEVAAKLSKLKKIAISDLPWPLYTDKPEVNLTVAHAGHAILLKYQVKEKNILARFREINQPVYKDSCVEFFISFNNEKAYYSFEFNCLGTCLAEFGESKQSREMLSPSLIREISTNSVVKSTATDGAIHWELSLMIPNQIFYKHDINFLSGRACRMNFFKCGDDLPEPHYLSWTKIVSDVPNFHLPEFFGSGIFELNPEPAYT